MNPSQDARNHVDLNDEQSDQSHDETGSNSTIRAASRDAEKAPAEQVNADQNKLSVRNARGFAGMDPARQREIAAQGGRAAHQQGTAHKFDSEEARVAGRKGGQASGISRSSGENSKTERRQ